MAMEVVVALEEECKGEGGKSNSNGDEEGDGKQ